MFWFNATGIGLQILGVSIALSVLERLIFGTRFTDINYLATRSMLLRWQNQFAPEDPAYQTFAAMNWLFNHPGTRKAFEIANRPSLRIILVISFLIEFVISALPWICLALIAWQIWIVPFLLLWGVLGVFLVAGVYRIATLTQIAQKEWPNRSLFFNLGRAVFAWSWSKLWQPLKYCFITISFLIEFFGMIPAYISMLPFTTSIPLNTNELRDKYFVTIGGGYVVLGLSLQLTSLFWN